MPGVEGEWGALAHWIAGEVASARFGAAALFVFIGGVMRGFSGFGAGMVLVPSIALIYGPVAGVAISTLLNGLATFQLLPRALRATRWDEALPIVIPAFALAPFGVYVLLVVDPDIMRRVIGAAVLAFVGVMSAGWRYRGRPRLSVKIAVGALSGALTGSTGAGGPPVIVYLLAGPFSPEEVRGNIITVSTANRLGVLVAFLLAAALTAEMLGRALLLMIVFFAAVHTGTRLFGRVDEAVFRRIAMVFLLGVSLSLILKP